MLPKGIGLTTHPGRIRFECAECHKHPSHGDVEERQQKELPQSLRRHDPFREEVALPEGFRVHLQEFFPRSFAALGTWIQLMLYENILHGLTGNFSHIQFPEFSQNAGVAPVILPGQLTTRSRISSAVFGRPGILLGAEFWETFRF